MPTPSEEPATQPHPELKRFPQIAVLRLAGIGPARYALTLAVGLLLSANFIATAMLNSTIFSELLGARDHGKLTGLIIALAIVLAIRPLLAMLREWASARLGLTMKITLRDRIAQSIARRGPMRLSRHNSGDLQTLMTDGVEQTQTYYGGYIPQIVICAVTSVFVAGWLAQYSVLIAVVQFILAIIVFAVPRLWDKALAEKGQTHWIAYADLNSEFIDSMMGMTTLKAFNAAERRGRQLARRSAHLLDSTLNQLKLSLGETGVSAAIMVLGPAIGLALGLHSASRGEIAMSDLFMITLLSAEIFRPLRELANLWHAGFMGLAASREIESFLSQDPTHPGGPENRPGRDSGRTAATSGDAGDVAEPGDATTAIALDGVGYTYDGSDGAALTSITARIEKGETTAIVGGSGSGKSTLLGLILGMDAPTTGTIAILGRDPRGPHALDPVTMVPQDPMIFPGTIASALRDGAPDADEATMLHALELAGLSSIGDVSGRALLDVTVDERGGNLSGGQRQRLAIARAIVSRPAIVILDESTSALDSAVERRILARLRSDMPGTTLIMVTHRMDTAADCDHVLVIERGRLTEAGPPGELLERPGGTFARLMTESSASLGASTAPGEGGRR